MVVRGGAGLSVAGGLLERERELARIGGMLGAARDGEGGLLLISGVAGIGKTSLLDACAAEASGCGMEVLRGRGDELVMESAFAAVREIFWGIVGKAGAGLFDGAACLARPVFESNAPGGVGPDQVAGVLHGLYWLAANVAERGPTVLLVDDAHWLDVASARFLAYLGRRVESLPVLLTVAVRRGEGRDPGGMIAVLAELAAGQLAPEALSATASTTLVRGGLGARADEDLCRSCYEATSGNPFYLRQLVAALRTESGRPSVAVAERVRALGVGTVGRSVLLRLARLGGDCRAVAEALAVLAPGSPLRHAAWLAGLDRERARAAVQALCEAELVVADRGLSFVHPIVREAIAAELVSARRAGLHLEAARLLVDEGAAADRVAAHLLAAEPFGEGWVVDALRSAARDALARGAPEAAVSYLRRAVVEPPAAETRLEVLLELGRAEAMLPADHDFPALREALALAPDPRQRAEIAVELSHGLGARGRISDAVRLLEGVLNSGEELDPALMESIEAHLLGIAAGDLAATRRVLARTARHFERAKRGEVRNPVMLAALAMTGAIVGLPASEVAALARLALADETLLREIEAPYVGASSALCLAERLDEAARAQDAGIAEAQRRGSAPMFMFMSIWRGQTALRAGELAAAEDHSRRAYELAREVGSVPYAVMLFTPVLLECGHVEEAFELVGSIELAQPSQWSWIEAKVLAGRGRVRVERGELEDGVADLLDAGRRMTAAGCDLSVFIDWVPTAASALARLARHDEAEAVASRELSDADRFGSPRRRGIALSTCGLLDPGAQGLAWLREALTVLERSPARLEHARALLNLGVGLRARGAREQARDLLYQALDFADRCGAVALAEQARVELIAAGARPRRRALTGVQALTPAELRTATMAAQGLTNRQIGQALFITTKAVEGQLSMAFAKLGIDGRSKLARALATNAQPERPATRV